MQVNIKIILILPKYINQYRINKVINNDDDEKNSMIVLFTVDEETFPQLGVDIEQVADFDDYGEDACRVKYLIFLF